MVSNDVDLLRKGLTSEYFLASFLEKDPSGYGLAQVVQNKTGRPDTSKTYDVLKRLTDSRYLVEINEKYYPNLEKLTGIIDSTPLQDWQQPIDPDEKDTLVGMLQNREFFKIVSGEILDEMYGQPNRVHNIDALRIISNKIGLLTAAILLYRIQAINMIQGSSDGDSSKQNSSLSQINEEQKDFGVAWNEQVIPMLKEMAFEKRLVSNAKKVQKAVTKNHIQQKKYVKKEQKDSVSKQANMKLFSDAIMIFLKSMPSLRLFLFVPENTLWKLCRLWEGYDSFEFVVKVIQGLQIQNKKLSE